MMARTAPEELSFGNQRPGLAAQRADYVLAKVLRYFFVGHARFQLTHSFLVATHRGQHHDSRSGTGLPTHRSGSSGALR
jgi:hypothetical protein